MKHFAALAAFLLVFHPSTIPSVRRSRLHWPLESAVKSEQTMATSLMPEGLLQTITAQEAADLVEYLGSLK